MVGEGKKWMCTESRRENKKAERNPGLGHWQTRSMKTHMSFYGHVNFPLFLSFTSWSSTQAFSSYIFPGEIRQLFSSQNLCSLRSWLQTKTRNSWKVFCHLHVSLIGTAFGEGVLGIEPRVLHTLRQVFYTESCPQLDHCILTIPQREILVLVRLC